ncbi:MAG: hypothetical protein K2Q12_05740 [Rickettsiales bacterium]|nr:hypothetical protein [Rickettsiales bacterium]
MSVLVGAISGFVASIFTTYFSGVLLWRWHQTRGRAYKAVDDTIKHLSGVEAYWVLHAKDKNYDHPKWVESHFIEVYYHENILRLFVSENAANALKQFFDVLFDGNKTAEERKTSKDELLRILKNELEMKLSFSELYGLYRLKKFWDRS